jgi:hypothetical protein
MRAHAFYSIAQDWLGSGKSNKDLKELASVINHITGRGDLSGLKKLENALNIMFFAPKLFVGRIQTITDLVPISDGKLSVSPTRKLLAGTLLKAVGTGLLILGLLRRMKGVQVEDDPRSSDFGKIRIGDTRIDFWGGYSQIARLGAGMIVGVL